MPYIVGCDPSLSSTGLCVYSPEDQRTYVAQIDGHRADYHVGQRCRSIANMVLHEISTSGIVDACDHVDCFIEAPLGPMQGFAKDLPILYWAIIMALEDEEFLHVTIYPVSSATLKKHLCSRGNAKPEDKVVAVLSKLKHMIPEKYIVSPETKGGISVYKDLYDAIGLASLGHCVLGGDGFTKAQRESIAKVVRL